MLSKGCQQILNISIRRIHTSLCRNAGKQYENISKRNARSATYYATGVGILAIGLTYAAVPLYRMFCQATGYGGAVNTGHDASKVETMKPVRKREIKVLFNADKTSSINWDFHPYQRQITVVPGETALAFYTARNPMDVAVTGISTYNVVPFEAAQYFNKIQCFCFEEQQLNPHETVDMPVFFYIDPAFTEDPRMEFVDEIILSYTFYEAKEALNLPLGSYVKKHLF